MGEQIPIEKQRIQEVQQHQIELTLELQQLEHTHNLSYL
jgi:hypothetical protein